MKKLLFRVSASLGLLTILALVAAWLWFDDEHVDLDSATRARLNATFIELSEGLVHFELAGPQAIHCQPSSGQKNIFLASRVPCRPPSWIAVSKPPTIAPTTPQVSTSCPVSHRPDISVFGFSHSCSKRSGV